MTFNNITELSRAIDQAVGQKFLVDFQSRYKQLKGAERTLALKLFGNLHDEDHWAINQGAGTEVQYHISYYDTTLFYGLGFSSQYVQFKNDLSPVDYIRPFMQAYLAQEQKVRQLLPAYRFVRGSREELVKPVNNHFVLFGKTLPLKVAGGTSELSEANFAILIQDLKAQLPAYELIYSTKNQRHTGMHQISNYIDLLKNIKPQLILQGAPGTGKTYTAQEIAYRMIFGQPLSKEKDARLKEIKKLEASDQYHFVQFHPAYSYEDFIRGISAKVKGVQLEYKPQNRAFADFAALANQNLLDSKKPADILTREEWVQQMIFKFLAYLEDKIAANQGLIKLTDTAYITRMNENTIRYTGEAWKIDGGVPFTDLKEMYLAGVSTLQQVRELSTLTLSAKGNSTYWLKMLELFRTFLTETGAQEPHTATAHVQLKPFVFVIDEINRANLPAVLGELIYALEYRDLPMQSIYDIDEGENMITVPSNLYIIGTMNTADRSVGHIDYAIRRRFAFAGVTAEESVITNPQAKTLFRLVKKLFVAEMPADTIYKSSEFEADDLMPGHSYFLADNTASLELKLTYEILPILKEYVRDGILTDLPPENIQRFYDALIE